MVRRVPREGKEKESKEGHIGKPSQRIWRPGSLAPSVYDWEPGGAVA
jgi:hypothetical protein